MCFVLAVPASIGGICFPKVPLMLTLAQRLGLTNGM